MPPVAEAATRALARQQADNLTRFLRQEQALSVQLATLAAATVGVGPEAAANFLTTYVDEMAAALAGSDVFASTDGGARLDAMLSSLGHGLAGALAGHAWAGPVVERSITEARARYVPRAAAAPRLAPGGQG
jgi:hypothetical protein